MAKSKNLVFVNGAWLTSGCWDDFRKPFEKAGYTVHTPSWPLLGGASAAELRANPPKGLGSLSVGAIVDHYQAFIDTLETPPLIIGHSFGGLYVQMLLDRGVGSAGIAIDPGPTAFVIPGPLSLLAASPVLARIGAWARPFTLSFKAFQKNFANRNSLELQKAAYERLVVPTSGLIFHQAAFSIGTGVHPKRRHQPLLVTGAQYDRTVDTFTSRGVFNLQKSSPAPTEYKEFANHSHFLIGEPGWEEVAGFCLEWAKKYA